MKTQSMQSKGLAVLKMMIFSKPRRPLDATTSGTKRFNYFFPQLAKKIQSQESSYDSVIMDSLQRIQIDLSHKFDLLIFNLCYPCSSKSRGVSSSKERTGLSYGKKKKLCFWSISLLFISAQALALGNYTE